VGYGTGLVRSADMDSLSAAGPDRPERRRSLLGSTWTRAALAIAAVEAVLVVAGVLSRWAAVAIAVVLLIGYFAYGRRVRNPSTRQAAWAVALSQGLVLFVPLALWIIGATLLLLLAVAAVFVLVFLVVDRGDRGQA
jgi:hypothetical protein